eukprot:COSAG05_NODE_87_length_20404_cov_42.272051_11_plen_128_part_00
MLFWVVVLVVVQLWELPSERAVASSSPSTRLTAVTTRFTTRAHEKDINAVAVAPNERVVATASQDRTLKLWSTDKGELMGVCKGHKRGIWAAAFSPVDRVVATASGTRVFSCMHGLHPYLLFPFRER